MNNSTADSFNPQATHEIWQTRRIHTPFAPQAEEKKPLARKTLKGKGNCSRKLYLELMKQFGGDVPLVQFTWAMLRKFLPRNTDKRQKRSMEIMAKHEGPQGREWIERSWRRWNDEHWKWPRSVLQRVLNAANPYLSIRTDERSGWHFVSTSLNSRQVHELSESAYVLPTKTDMKRCNYDWAAAALYVHMKFVQEGLHPRWDKTYEELGAALGMSVNTVKRKMKLFAKYVELGWKISRASELPVLST